MFRFLFGVVIGAFGYWAWQSFGRDLLGMGGDQGATTYAPYSGSTSYGTTAQTSTPAAGATNTAGDGAAETTAGGAMEGEQSGTSGGS